MRAKAPTVKADSPASNEQGIDMDNSLYEDDEPLDSVVRAFEQGTHGITSPPNGPVAWFGERTWTT